LRPERSRDLLAAYIRNQREHHRVKSFQEELRAFLKAYEVEFDERYLWDWKASGDLSGRTLCHLLHPGHRPSASALGWDLSARWAGRPPSRPLGTTSPKFVPKFAPW